MYVRGEIVLFFPFGLAQTLKRSTALSMFYIACCAFVLMKHNVNGIWLVRLKTTKL